MFMWCLSDRIRCFSGVYLTESGEARLGGLNRCTAISIDKLDFSVTYDCNNKEWTASWKWANGHSPSELSNSVRCLVMPGMPMRTRPYSGSGMDGYYHIQKKNLAHPSV